MLKVVFKSVGTSLLTVLLGFIYSVIIARALGPEGRGIVGTALMTTVLIAGFAQMGLAQGFIYHRRHTERFSIPLLIKASFIVTAITACLVLFTDLFLLPEELIPYRHIWFILAFVTALQLFFQNSVQIDKSLNTYNLAKFLTPTSNILGLGALVLLGTGQVSVENVIIIGTIALAIACLLQAFKTFSHEIAYSDLSKLPLRETLPYSIKVYGTSLTGICINSFDKVILLILGSMTDFGLYVVAYGISRLAGIVPDTIATVTYSRFAGKDSEELRAFTNRAFTALFLPLLLVAAVVASFAPWLIPFVFGNDYSLAVIPFVLLLFECILSSTSWLLAQRFNAIGKPGLVLLRQLLSLIPLFTLPFILTGFSPIIALSIAMLASAILRIAVTLVMYKRSLGESLPNFVPSTQEIGYLRSLITKTSA